MAGARSEENSQWKTITCLGGPELVVLASERVMIKNTIREVLFLPNCIQQATMITVEVVETLLLSVQINGAFDMAATALV